MSAVLKNDLEVPVFKTTFAKRNPFTGQPAKPIRHVDTGLLSICDDPLPARRAEPVNKYDALFKSMKPGQCIKCPGLDAPKIAQAMAKWLQKTDNNRLMVRSTKDYEGTGEGRVWLLKKEAKA